MSHINRSIAIAAAAAALAALAACSKSKNAIVDTTTPQAPIASNGTVASPSADSMTMVRGSIASVSPTQVVVTTDSGSTTVALSAPVTVYDRSASTLTNVKDNTFIGVTTVKQPDGSERATEIHIFPEALRGLGEGSRMMATGAQMTNGAATPARMSNGNVASSTGSTMVVQYAGGSQSVTIPPNTPVTEIKATSKPLTAGDVVVVVATKGAGGSLSANRVLLARK